MDELKEIDIKDLDLNPIKLFPTWAVLSSGNSKDFDGMTISWGHIGNIWGDNRPTAIVYIRPSRYTLKCVENSSTFTISFFDSKYKKDLSIIGSKSKYNVKDKMSLTSLHPYIEDNNVLYKEANLILVCKKIYVSRLEEKGFLDKSIIDECYPKKDFHYVFYGDIIKVYKK